MSTELSGTDRDAINLSQANVPTTDARLGNTKAREVRSPSPVPSEHSASQKASPESTLDTILTKALNDFYDYITEQDIIKAAHEYSEKTVYKTAKASLLHLIDEARIEAAENELACVRAGGHDDVGLLPNTTTGSSCKYLAQLREGQQ